MFDILTIIKAHIESGKSVRSAALAPDEFEFIEELSLLTKIYGTAGCRLDPYRL